MNSEERPAPRPDRLTADQQHTVPARPVKAHFALFRRERPSFVWQNPTLTSRTSASPPCRRHRVEALRDALSHTQTSVCRNPGYAAAHAPPSRRRVLRQGPIRPTIRLPTGPAHVVQEVRVGDVQCLFLGVPFEDSVLSELLKHAVVNLF